jgi:hypothetical protein
MKPEWVYQLFLKLYPRGFQEKYSREMLLTFRNDLREAQHRNKKFSRMQFLAAALSDVLKTVVEQHFLAGKEAQMPLNRWSWIARGLCILAGGVLLSGSILLWSMIEARGLGSANELELIIRMEPSLMLFLGLLVLLNLTSVLAITGHCRQIGMRDAWFPATMAAIGFMVSIWGLARFPAEVVEPPSIPWITFWIGLLLGFTAWATLGVVVKRHAKTRQHHLILLLVGLLGMTGFAALPLVKFHDVGLMGSAIECVTLHTDLPISNDETKIFTQPVGTFFRCIAEAESQNFTQTVQIVNLKRAEFFGFQCLLLTSIAMIWLGLQFKPEEIVITISRQPSNQFPEQS